MRVFLQKTLRRDGYFTYSRLFWLLIVVNVRTAYASIHQPNPRTPMKKRNVVLCVSVALIALASLWISLDPIRAQNSSRTNRFNYPQTKTVDVVDDYFGTKVVDPYRWLEANDSPEV